MRKNHTYLAGTLTAVVISAAAVAGVGAAMAGVAAAQPRFGGGPGEDGPNRMGHFARAAEFLELTEDQRAQLRDAFEQNQPERSAAREQMREQSRALRELMESDAPDPTAVGEAMLAMKRLRAEGQATRQAHQETFKSLLTPEQLRKWELVEASRISGDHPGRRSRHGRGRHSRDRQSAPPEDQR